MINAERTFLNILPSSNHSNVEVIIDSACAAVLKIFSTS